MEIEEITKLSSGAKFFRGDLHIHTYGASPDVLDNSATAANIVELAHAEGLSLIAITDHNEIGHVREAVDLGTKKGITVIPGVELSTPEGHLLCYAPNPDALERFYNRLSIADRRTERCRCQTGTLECLNLLRAEGGFGILAHIDLQGAFESNVPRFTPAKLDILCHVALLGFEVSNADAAMQYNRDDGDADRKNVALERVKRLGLATRQHLARVMNSDAHTLKAVGRNAKSNQRMTRYKMEAPTFDGLRIAMEAADTRVRLEEEIPEGVPIILGVQCTGGFLDGQAVHFSPNLTCIIGGRGSGKSTLFESLRLLGSNYVADENSVIDSDVWPDELTLVYRDGTHESHALGRSKEAELQNIDDPLEGPVSFPIESYRQGETNEISKRVQEDPLALLTFLDRLIDIEGAIAEEDALREAVNELSPKVSKAKANVDKIPGYEKELKLKQDQLARLKKEKGEEVIKLQQRLETERRARNQVDTDLTKLSGAIGQDAALTIVGDISQVLAGGGGVEIGAPEAARIRAETGTFEKAVTGSAEALKQETNKYVTKARAEIAAWKAKESETASEIEAKKKELLGHGIRLDMPFIQKLVADEARTAENIRALKTWVPELDKLRKDYSRTLLSRWKARERVGTLRTAFAVRASTALKGALSDLFVSLKYETSCLSPEAERLIVDAMSWRTLQHLKAGALIKELTLPLLLDCVRRQAKDKITALKNESGVPVFTANEAELLLERLAEPELLAQLESVAVHDMPRLSVTKRVEDDRGERFIPRDFKRLSLGQQQSVLLALMLTSDSNAPLIVDQPEDNLDSEFIYKTLVPVIRAAKERRQVIMVTHNANIAVLGDAEQIVVLRATNEKASIVERGSIDEPRTRESACGILEGSREAFERRGRIYGPAK